MKLLVLSMVLLALLVSLSVSQTFPSYYSTSDLAFTSPGALKFGLYGYENPALLTYVRQHDLEFVWTDASEKWNDFNRWGLFSASPNFGMAMVKTKIGSASVIDYRLSVGFGDKSAGFGLAYGFTGGDKAEFNRSNVWTLGALVRPEAHVSVGVVGNAITSWGKTEAAIDLGFRPLGNELVTLYADHSIQSGKTLREGGWSYGAALEALPGIRFTGRYFDTHAFAFGISLSLGRAGFSGERTFDKEGKQGFNTYAIRLGAYDRTVLSKLSKGSKYVELNLFGGMKYQRFILFDNANTLRGTLDAIAAARDDETIGGIAINTSGMNINREMLWELRQRLQDFKESGKKVIVFVDRPSMEEYTFATVADRIVLDPTGMIVLPGYVMGNTYLKGTLEKLGIGFDEWRFFKYKSADEFLSREKMSDADREQKQKYIDDLYALTKQGVCNGRHLTSEQFEKIINEEVVFMPHEAVQRGLVDTLGRWDEVKAMVKEMEGKGKSMVGAGTAEKFNLPYDDRWGERPRIALIYALGVCAMDEGIKARSLVRDVEAAANDPKIKAIVLRVDSPGGDGMASDYIAEAMKRARKNKPVIVSQGYVAGSGGYWLSMYADTIVAAPSTITGSIGVIGGWMYNKDLKEKLGFSTDHVQVGAHADLGFGFRLPFIGAGLPDRNLTEAERAVAERSIKSYYADFIGKVAEGRKSTSAKIDSIGQGRFYSGIEGKTIGLVDVLGGLDDAIRIARHRVGIGDDEDITIVELPRPGLFDLSGFIPRLLGLQQPDTEDPLTGQLKLRLEHNGEPLPIMPLDEMSLSVPNQ